MKFKYSPPHSETLKTHDFTAHPAHLRERGAGQLSTWRGDPWKASSCQDGEKGPSGSRREGPTDTICSLLGDASLGRGKCHRKDAVCSLRPDFPLQERKMPINPVLLHGEREKWHSSGEVKKDQEGHLFGDSHSISFCQSRKGFTFTLQSSWQIQPRTHS